VRSNHRDIDLKIFLDDGSRGETVHYWHSSKSIKMRAVHTGVDVEIDFLTILHPRGEQGLSQRLKLAF
jgi:hypothetical protein